MVFTSKCVIAQIKTIKMANKVVKYYQISDQDHPTLQLEVQELNITEVDGVYRWGGSYLDNMFIFSCYIVAFDDLTF